MQLVKMKSDWIKVGSKSNLTAVLRKDTETHREECQVRTEAEIGVMHLQDKEWQGWSPKAQRQGRERLPLRFQKEPTLLTPWFQTFSFQKMYSVREYVSVVLSFWFVVLCMAGSPRK